MIYCSEILTFAPPEVFSMQAAFPVAPLLTGVMTMQLWNAVPFIVIENAP
jgi:hypothetical protein